MNKILLGTFGLLPLSASLYAQSAENQPDKRPNIIFFLVDDMGWQDTSLPFWTEKTPYNRLYETPNMERLARQGMMFTQAYASSISSPTRCSLMTGANAARHRVTNWTLQKNRSTDAESETLQLPEWNWNGIAQTGGTSHTFVAKSFVQLLKESGYHTIHCGKAHWGAIDTPGENPCHFGFETNIAGHAAGGLATYLSELNYGHDAQGNPTSLMSVPGLEKYWQTGTFVTEALTQEALKALDKAKQYNQPFYLYMSHYAIHIPIDKDTRYFEKYKQKGMSDKEAAYASLIEGMDKSLGDIMDWLEKNGEADNTIILFMGDNGGYATGSHWRDEPLYTQNAPLNCGKGSAYEGGIREPMIVSWPGVTQPSSGATAICWLRTISRHSRNGRHHRLESPANNRRSKFCPSAQTDGDPSEGRSLYWNCPNLWGEAGPGIGATCSIRQGKWKLIYFYETGQKELYDIPADISEQHNLAASHPEVVKRLSKDLGNFLRSSGGQRPSFKATGKPCPWPDEI